MRGFQSNEKHSVWGVMRKPGWLEPCSDEAEDKNCPEVKARVGRSQNTVATTD